MTIKSSSRFDRINKFDHDYSYFIHCLPLRKHVTLLISWSILRHMQRWSWCPKLLLPWQRDVTTFTLHFLSSTPDFFTQTEQRRRIGRAAQPLRFCPLKSKHVRIKVENKIHLSEHWNNDVSATRWNILFCFSEDQSNGSSSGPKTVCFSNIQWAT